MIDYNKLNTIYTNPNQFTVLYTIQTLTDPLISLLADDPVRPQIPADFRVSDCSEIFVLLDSYTGAPGAVVCVAYQSQVPASVDELLAPNHSVASPSVAVFYTIWSYGAGAGSQLIRLAVDRIQQTRPHTRVFVTLSPTTEMARKFHLRNGARVFRHNADTVNYLYRDLESAVPGSVADCVTGQ